MMDTALNNLQDRCNVLKSRLRHEKLNSDSYSFRSFKREMSQILKEYFHEKSLFKAAFLAGMDPKIVLKWYVQGQNGNPQFRTFYLMVNHINGRQTVLEDTCQNDESPHEFKEEFIISEYGDGWSYTTYVDGEKIFLISDELESLKNKVKSKNLPID